MNKIISAALNSAESLPPPPRAGKALVKSTEEAAAARLTDLMYSSDERIALAASTKILDLSETYEKNETAAAIARETNAPSNQINLTPSAIAAAIAGLSALGIGLRSIIDAEAGTSENPLPASDQETILDPNDLATYVAENIHSAGAGDSLNSPADLSSADILKPIPPNVPPSENEEVLLVDNTNKQIPLNATLSVSVAEQNIEGSRLLAAAEGSQTVAAQNKKSFRTNAR